ncbi:MAG: holo-ACP synthase [Deltaproteobacteria bacterium]|nr:holo-ACP synthase [Deltaproteobacteria bacterium]
MAIVGTGVDVAEVARVRAALEEPTTGARFRARVFTQDEQRYCEARGAGRFQSYAARFAAKEAVMKALGLGWGRHIGWLDVEVVRAEDGRPTLRLHGKGGAAAGAAGVARFHLALSHTREIAIAQVIAEGAAA